MKKIKEYLNFLVDKKTLSYIVPYYFSIVLSVIYLIISYDLTTIHFGYVVRDSNTIFQMISENFYTIFFIIWISIWLYYILKIWYQLWEYIFKEYIQDNDIKRIKSLLILLYWTWLSFLSLFLHLLIIIFFDFSLIEYSMYLFYYKIIIFWLSFLFSFVELIIFEDNTKLRNLSLLTVLLIILFLIIFFILFLLTLRTAL